MQNIFVTLAWFALPAAWFTHVFFCFSKGFWGFLIAGALFFPIGILHGFYIWFFQ